MLLFCLQSAPRTGNELAGVDVETVKTVSWHLQISHISYNERWSTLELMYMYVR